MITYIIVDDETASHDNIGSFAENLPNLVLRQNCYNAFEAMEYLAQHQVDLIFLDINMPKLSGFDFLKTLDHPPRIIVTTAYREFALEGYELNIDDYLLKPFSLQRFLKAVAKVSSLINKETGKVKTNSVTSDHQSIFIKNNKKHYQIKIADILFIEAYGNYVKVHTEKDTILTHQTLSSVAVGLPKELFLKVHKSYVVAVRKIQSIAGNQIFLEAHKIPVGKVYRSAIDELLGRDK